MVGASQRGVSENMEELPFQGSSVEKTRARINSWAEIHEEKWRRVPTKSKYNIQENNKTLKRVLHRPMIMYGGKGKKFKNVVLLRILNISEK